MNEAQQTIGYLLSAHVALLLASVVAFYKYGDRTDILRKALDDTDRFLRGLRTKLATEFSRIIGGLLAESGVNPTLIASPLIYTERPTNIAESEALRDAMTEFVESNHSLIVDYRTFLSAHRSWCRWVKRMSWLILTMIIWECVALFVIGGLKKVFGVDIPEDVVKWSIIPSATFIMVILVCAVIMLKRHDKINKGKEEYPDLSV